MSCVCPWCQTTIEPAGVRDLSHIPRPCPKCGKPIRQSFIQVLFVVAVIMPLIALTLYFSKMLYELGHSAWSIVIFLIGAVVAIAVQKYIPTIHGPARGSG